MNKKVKIIIIILIIAALGTIGSGIYLMMNDTGTNKTSEKTKEKNSTDKDDNNEVDSNSTSTISTDVESIIKYVNGGKEGETSPYYYNSILTYGSLSKFRVALYVALIKNDNITIKEYSELDEEIKNKITEENWTNNYKEYTTTYENLNNYYKLLFGEDAPALQETEIIKDSVYYDKKNNYIATNKGTKELDDGCIIYVNKTENSKDNEYTYAYVNVGHIKNISSKEAGVAADIYNGYTGEEKVETIETPMIDKNNYINYKEYKYTFKNDNNSYYLESIEENK